MLQSAPPSRETPLSQRLPDWLSATLQQLGLRSAAYRSLRAQVAALVRRQAQQLPLCEHSPAERHRLFENIRAQLGSRTGDMAALRADVDALVETNLAVCANQRARKRQAGGAAAAIKQAIKQEALEQAIAYYLTEFPRSASVKTALRNMLNLHFGAEFRSCLWASCLSFTAAADSVAHPLADTFKIETVLRHSLTHGSAVLERCQKTVSAHATTKRHASNYRALKNHELVLSFLLYEHGISPLLKKENRDEKEMVDRFVSVAVPLINVLSQAEDESNASFHEKLVTRVFGFWHRLPSLYRKGADAYLEKVVLAVQDTLKLGDAALYGQLMRTQEQHRGSILSGGAAASTATIATVLKDTVRFLFVNTCDTALVNFVFDHFVILLATPTADNEKNKDGFEQWLVYFAVSLLFAIKDKLMACQRAEEVRTAVYLHFPQVSVAQVQRIIAQHFYKDAGLASYARSLAAADASAKYWKPADADVASLDERDLVESESVLRWSIRGMAGQVSRDKRVQVERLMKKWRKVTRWLVLWIRFIHGKQDDIRAKKIRNLTRQPTARSLTAGTPAPPAPEQPAEKRRLKIRKASKAPPPAKKEDPPAERVEQRSSVLLNPSTVKGKEAENENALGTAVHRTVNEVSNVLHRTGQDDALRATQLQEVYKTSVETAQTKLFGRQLADDELRALSKAKADRFWETARTIADTLARGESVDNSVPSLDQEGTSFETLAKSINRKVEELLYAPASKVEIQQAARERTRKYHARVEKCQQFVFGMLLTDAQAGELLGPDATPPPNIPSDTVEYLAWMDSERDRRRKRDEFWEAVMFEQQ